MISNSNRRQPKVTGMPATVRTRKANIPAPSSVDMDCQWGMPPGSYH